MIFNFYLGAQRLNLIINPSIKCRVCISIIFLMSDYNIYKRIEKNKNKEKSEAQFQNNFIKEKILRIFQKKNNLVVDLRSAFYDIYVEEFDKAFLKMS